MDRPRRVFLNASAACLALALPLAGALAASPAWAGGGVAQTAASTLHVHGTVTDGVTGKPIARALVVSNDHRLATLTNNQGVFALEVTLEPEVGQGTGGRGLGGSGGSGPEARIVRVFLSAQRPGYLPQQTRPASVVLSASAEPPAIELRLMPSATVAGHISTERGGAARRVAVNLLQRTFNNGERTWNRTVVHRTDADGAFRFTGLRAGEYTVMTEEWRGDQPLPSARDAITEQYPPVFLGDATDVAGAVKLQLRSGESATADLHLRLATYYPVTVPVTGGAEGFVNVRLTGADAVTGFRLSYVPNRHAVEGSLPDGTYGLELTSTPAGTRQTPRGQAPERSYGVGSIHIAGAPVQTAPVALVTPAPIDVRLHREFTGKEVPEHFQARVYLQPVEQGQPFVMTNTEGDSGDEISLPGAAPGQYTVRVEPSYGYAAQVRCGGVDLNAEKLTVATGGSQPIDIVLRDDTATVSGTVRSSGARSAAEAAAADADAQAGLPGSFVVLTPVGGEGKFSLAGTGADGRFHMPNVAPGSYRIFAIDGTLWDSPSRDPEALRSLGDKGVALQVTPNATLQVEVPVLDAAALEAK